MDNLGLYALKDQKEYSKILTIIVSGYLDHWAMFKFSLLISTMGMYITKKRKLR